MSKTLLLGGTAEARRLARTLHQTGADVVTALAGLTEADYDGAVRVGGFGGETGLVEALREGAFTRLVDATHPFAARISRSAQKAAAQAAIPYLRLERQPWQPPSGVVWQEAETLTDAADLLVTGEHVFAAVGAKSLAPFVARRDVRLTVRALADPDLGGRCDVTVIKGRPGKLDEERALFKAMGFDRLVTKNAGGNAAAGKLQAAYELGVPVLMVQRPTGQPKADATSVEGMLALLGAAPSDG
ncbi:MAG: precorrin-6A/cobalt-precorrin-6A reductase [Pseudomonadota bacterium]